jgi:hypothetical protein
VFGGVRVPVREYASTVTVGHFATPRFGWSVGAGAILGGSVEGRDMSPGATIAAALSWLPIYERAHRPFVSLSASISGGLARAVTDTGARAWWSPWDLRGGVLAGKTFGPFVPYIAARVFGGPVFWTRGGDSVIGGDRWHVTAGAGATIRLPARLDLSVEVMPLGEQSAAGALTIHF